MGVCRNMVLLCYCDDWKIGEKYVIFNFNKIKKVKI